jgi:acetolactate synthase-1/2/3 large subunit
LNSSRAALSALHLLRDRGVRYAFGVPGESFLGLLDAFHETPEICLVTTRHEGGAAFMADAVGKLTGTPAICMGTRGVGAANLAVGLHTAYQDSTPLLAFVGQVETLFRHRDALQEVEIAPFLGQVTKWAVEAPSGARLPAIVAEAYRRSVTGRPGPVAVAVRGDILDEVASDPLPAQTATAATAVRSADAAAIVSLLGTAERPLILAGGGVTRAAATADLVALAERLGVPVMTAFRRHDAFPNDHPLYLGPLSFGAPPSVAARARAADVVFALGTRLSEMTTLGYTLPSPQALVIYADVSPDAIGRTVPATIGVVADAGTVVEALLAAATEGPHPERIAANRSDRADYEAGAAFPEPPAVADLVDPAVVVAELRKQLPPTAILATDAGNFWGWMVRYFWYLQPRTLLAPTAGAMGYAVPAAIAAALVTGSRAPVIAIAGDGGFLMTSSELAVAAQLDLKVTCVVFDNALYGTIRLHQEREYPGRVAGTELWSPDLVSYAEAFGGLGIRVERNEDVPDAIRAALAYPGISVVSVAVARETIAVGTALSKVAIG